MICESQDELYLEIFFLRFFESFSIRSTLLHFPHPTSFVKINPHCVSPTSVFTAARHSGQSVFPVSLVTRCQLQARMHTEHSEALYQSSKEEALHSVHHNLCDMDASLPLSRSDSNRDSRLVEDLWDEIVDDDFSDNEYESSMSSSEDNDVVLLQAPLSAPPRTLWAVLAERLAESPFEARFVDAQQRQLNEAAIKRRRQLDPTKCHTWTSKCGRNQVIGYFNLYAQGTVGLFTEEGFPVYVHLHELSDKDARFVLDKLGVSLRGRVEAQLSAKQRVEQTELSSDSKGNQIEQEATNGRSQCLLYYKGKDWKDRLRDEVADRVPKAGVFVDNEMEGGHLYNKNAQTQPLQSHTAVDALSVVEEGVFNGEATNAKWEASPPAPIPPLAAQARASDGLIALNAASPDGRLESTPPETKQAGPGKPLALGPGPLVSENPTIELEEKHRPEEIGRLEYIRRGLVEEEKARLVEHQDMLRRAKQRHNRQLEHVQSGLARLGLERESTAVDRI